ncbi:MAG: DUF2961 domain-containing protein [Candidatus Aminicenantes bacterium]|nr:DUF2961 domain-containing protein [Candidatus Aminicenantes bacterium]
MIWILSTAVHSQNLLEKLSESKNYQSNRVSSYDISGGNNDRISIQPGETVELAEIKGPGAIHHIWVTISAEPFYGRKIVLRMYWDQEEHPSVEAPIGDFFGVGHGLNRNFSSLAINCSSQGRARNCYWYMPFQKSARITATNEGEQTVGAFYYYIDYRELNSLAPDTPYFHAQYRQDMPCVPGENYLILNASGRGHYVGCNLSILQRTMGWWGEGDDMIFIDGQEAPSFHGTGSEDYFSDAWGMREDENPFYGCPLQEPDFKAGSKATVYRHHIPDPIPFRQSIHVSIEHGHDNNRSDFFSSIAYWYQTEPHKAFPELPGVAERIPFSLASSGGLVLPQWKETAHTDHKVFQDAETGITYQAKNAQHSLTSYYNQDGIRYPVLSTENAQTGDPIKITLDVEIGEFYDIVLHYLCSPVMGKVKADHIMRGDKTHPIGPFEFNGYSPTTQISTMNMENIRLYPGENTLVLTISGKGDGPKGGSKEFGFVSAGINPCGQRFISDWNIIGPFAAPDMTWLQRTFLPEKELNVTKEYTGKNGKTIQWQTIASDESGFVPLQSLLKPNERVVAYAQTIIDSPVQREATLLIGSDDGIRVWLNEKLVHSNPAYRGAYPDQDRIPVLLHKGENILLLKILQGGGGWGFYARFVDPDHELDWRVK